MLWTTVIAFTLNETVRGRALGIHKKERSFHIFAWGIPLVLSLLPYSTGSYGPAGHVCWLLGDTTGTAWRFIQFYVPLWAAMMYEEELLEYTNYLIQCLAVLWPQYTSIDDSHSR